VFALIKYWHARGCLAAFSTRRGDGHGWLASHLFAGSLRLAAIDQDADVLQQLNIRFVAHAKIFA
jgi:hypothetical protein